MQARMQKIGRYEIERELGRGAMGIVYLARDTRLGRAVALKTIRLGDFADAEKLQRLRERLIREAQSAGSLSHENIVTIYDVDELDEISYISMEYVEGDSLERMMERRRELSREALLSLLRQIASGLDFAHSRGIVHRDVKPPNVMVTPLGRVKLTDFGVAKITYASSMTQGGAMLGTPDYMSPEQIDGRNVSGRTDQFSLGVIAFEMLTGEKPFVADSLASLIYRIAHEKLPEATLLNPSLSEEVSEVLQRSMAKRPEDRYPSCIAFLDALTEACQRAVGWHALPRGMSQTLPTAHEAAGLTPPSPAVTRAGLEPPPPARSIGPPTPVAGPPAPVPGSPAPVPGPPVPVARPMPALGGPAPVAEAGFITAPPVDLAATVEGVPTQTREWLRTVEQETASQQSRRRRTGLLALVGTVCLAVGLGAAYVWLGGALPWAPATVAPPGQNATASNPETGSVEAPFTANTASEGGQIRASAPDAMDAADAPVSDGGQDAPQAITAPTPTPATPVPAAPKESSRPLSTKEPVKTARFITEPPGARVTVDATPGLSCETPCTLELPVGRHTVSARMPGYRNEIRAMEVTNYGGLVNMKLERAVGMVRVISNPAGASVLVNGERQNGITPLNLRLLPGGYSIVIEREGRRVERRIQVREDAVVQLSAELAP
jgi:serine/threonine-protein kinase